MKSDPGATFRDFVVDASPGLLRYAHSLTADSHDALDLVQEVLIKMERRWGTIDNPVAYACRAMVRTNISLWRRRRHEVIGSPDPEPSHDSPADALGLRDELVRGLRRLSEKQRVVLVLRYIYDQSVQEIAEQTGMNPGTVASHLSRARRAMRSHLDHPATVNVKAGR